MRPAFIVLDVLKKVGITGGAGFIGGHVADHLLELGIIPVIFDRRGRFPAPPALERATGPGQVEAFLGDVTDPVAMSELGKHVDGIIHLAACLGTQETIRRPVPAFYTNIIGGLNFIDVCDESDIPGVNIAVGNWWMDNSYSISKHAVERAIRMSNKHRNTKINVVRAVNAYGPRQSVAPPFGPAKVRKITPAFVCRALTGQAIEIYGDGEQISDMVHVRDVARALVAALQTADAGDVLADPVGVGPYPSDSFTVNQVAAMISDMVFRMYGIPQMGLTHAPMRPGEIPGDRVSVDPDTLKQISINPASLIDFMTGIEETVAWFHDHWLPGYQQLLDADTILMPAAV